SPVEIAQIGQFAENEYFGKPCGLMDQMASAVGGFVMIDFKDKIMPCYEKIDVDFQSKNYALLIVDTKGNHQNLTPDYAGIPIEMGNVCRELGVNQCRDIAPDTFYDKIPELREKVGDRAVLRCMHFFKENERVGKMKVAMEEDNFSVFLDLINESGESSFCWLQNCYSSTYPDKQGISLGILLTQEYLKKRELRGACRVHGGGFAGSFEVFLPNSHVDDYRGLIEKIFGTGAVKSLKIRLVGANSFQFEREYSLNE
ncbi:MAG: galactokinase, partial [archaeon]